MFVLALRFAERKKFYESVSITQGEGKQWASISTDGLSSILVACFQRRGFTYLKILFLLFIGGLFEINLDKRKLKTPSGKLFTVPNEALAIAVANEWDVQKETLKFYTMHLVGYYYYWIHLDFPSFTVYLSILLCNNLFKVYKLHSSLSTYSSNICSFLYRNKSSFTHSSKQHLVKLAELQILDYCIVI